jgi:hypothetical protein
VNEVRIIVRTQNDTKPGFDSVRRETEKFAEDSANTYTQRFGQTIRTMGQRIAAPLAEAGQNMGEQLGDSVNRSFTQRLRDRLRRLGRDVDSAGRDAGDRIGDEIGRRAGETITRRIRESVRRSGGGAGRDGSDGRNGAPSGGIPGGDDSPGNFLSRLVGRMFGGGQDGAKMFAQGFMDGLNSFSQTIIGQAVMVLAVPLAAALSAPILSAVGAAITSGILLALGGGVIAVGIAGAFKDPRIAAAGQELKAKMGKMFEDFGKPFRGPVAGFMEKFSGFLDSIQPDLTEISNVFAPILDKLGTGVIGAMQNAWPGISEAIKASAPFVETLANRMPEIGQAIGDFFRKIAGQGDDAQIFFNDLITVIIKLIDWTGDLISAFTSWYNKVRNIITGMRTLFLGFLSWVIGIFGRILDAAAIAFSWIPGLGAKLSAAKAQFSSARSHINGELAKIRDKTVTIRMLTPGLAAAQTAASVARTLAGMGYAHGGIKGAQDGGLKSGMTWVGEQGPELVSLPAGARVHTAGDSRRLAAAVGGGETLLRVMVDRTTERGLIDGLMRALRFEIASQGGNVQAVLGR